MARVTGSSGKDYIFNSNGSITVNRPDGSSSTVSSSDKNWNSTVGAIKNDGVKYPSSTSSTTPKPSTNTSVPSTPSTTSRPSTSTSSSNTIAGTGGMTSAEYYAEVKRKQQAGQQLSNPTLYNSIAKKPYVTSTSNKTMYGNNTSTHMMKTSGYLDNSASNVMNVKDGYWKDHDYDFSTKDKGYILKDGRQISTSDAKSMANIPKYYVDENGNTINTGGTLDSTYFGNTKMSAMNNDERLLSQRSDNLVNTFGENIKHDKDIAQKQDAIINQYSGLNNEELQSLSQNGSHYEKNIANYLLGNMANDERYNIAPIAFAPDELQQGLTDVIYDMMRQQGIESFEGMNTKVLDEAINKLGLGGVFDINQVNDPYMMEQIMNKEASADGGKAELQIDSKKILDTLAQSGALKEGYEYNPETGQITPNKDYIQIGNILVNRGEAFSGYNNEESWGAGRKRNEDVTNMMYEEPLEWRAKYNPESMTDEMKADLQMERDIKAELEQLTLQLQQLEGGGGAGVILGGSSGGSGTGGSGTQNGNTGQTSGGFGSGGGSDITGITSAGRGAVYGTSQNYNPINQALLNAIGRKR